ncbi:MAG TPA: AAC(3) family N-acetyltransferase [Solirubrobacteraceae bacterium]|nr:AAC(3) family N-acetyltransferase [Solirubrobacteraceae bacterium]
MLVHSSLKAIGPVEGGAAAVIAALERTIGVAGTLIMPTFNFGFCSGETFDVRSTPSQMGVLTELVRTDPRARRVRHPIYSFAVLGALAEEAARLRNFSSYGADSLFAKLVEWDAKIMVIGLSYNNSMTFFHYVEEMEGCKYRYMKSFTAPYVDELGNGSERTYTMFVRDLERGVVTAVDPMGELLEREGAVVCGEVGESAARLMRARDVYAITARNLTDQPGLLFRIDISDSL